MNVAVIVAGGSGQRTGIGGGKQLATVAGLPVLYHTVAAFAGCAPIDRIVVVVHPDRIDEYRSVAVLPAGAGKVEAVVGGGATRQDSVAVGLSAVPDGADVIAVHDGARPLVTPELIAEAVSVLEGDGSLDGVVVGHPSYDTLKSVDAAGRVTGTLDRSAVWAAQTPQVFRAAALRRAYAEAAASGFEGTDDASLVERSGGRIAMVAGPRDNIKITVPEDLVMAESLLAVRSKGAGR